MTSSEKEREDLREFICVCLYRCIHIHIYAYTYVLYIYIDMEVWRSEREERDVIILQYQKQIKDYYLWKSCELSIYEENYYSYFL